MMKKLKLLFSLLLVMVSATAFAQDAQASCMVPGTNDYIAAYFYANSGGHTIKITNGSATPVASVTVEVRADVDMRYVGGKKDQVIYRGTVTDAISPYDTREINFSYKGELTNVRVSVYNPICK